MLFIEYPKCSTCQKAKKWLDENKIEYTQRHIVDDNPTYEEQLRLLATNGMLVKRPLIIADIAVLTGFKEAEWKEIIKNKNLPM
jgi:arsenate reductase